MNKEYNMAFLSRHKSAPHLLQTSDNTYIIVGLNSPSDEETEEDDEGEMSETEGGKSPQYNNDKASASGESCDITLLGPSDSETSRLSESEMSCASAADILREWKKKRQAPLPPDQSSTAPLRHSYAFEMEDVRLRNSTDSESTTSESRIQYQTSTDSEPIVPESARGSNFPGDLAGVNNLHADVSLRTPSQSPRERSSRLNRLRHAFRSPQIRRRKSKKVKSPEDKSPGKSPDDKSPGVGKPRFYNGESSTMKKLRIEEGSKSPRSRKSGNEDPLPEMSDWALACGYDDLIAEQEFEVKRIPDLDKYLSELLQETLPSHVDYDDLCKAAARVHSMVREREGTAADTESATTMEAVEEKCPVDDVQLLTADSVNHDDANCDGNGKTLSKLKGLSLRRRSAPSAVFFRPLSGAKTRTTTSIWVNAGMGKKEQDVITQPKMADWDSPSRMFIMEGPVQLATGMQTQERYLFLFTDILLVAKQKSNTAFKLKSHVELCDMWIASCIEEVSETTRPTDRSFVIGWPTTNVVLTFPRAEVKDKWLIKLSQQITEEKLKDEGKTLSLKVAPREIESSACQQCQMTINNMTQAKDVLQSCLQQLNIPENEAKDYQLWVLSGKEGSPYPLIGHETPFSIKLNHVRALTKSRSRDDIDTMTSGDLNTMVEETSLTGHKCEFYLKQKKTNKKQHIEENTYQKSMKKHKRQNIINSLFRRIRPLQASVFGRPLADICDENLDPPEPIIKLMLLVYQQGPSTYGILRRGNNAALGKEIREKIDTNVKYTLADQQVPTAASVFKEFLRCIPGGLLPNELHEQWISIQKDDPDDEKIEKIKVVLAKLTPPHYRLVKLTICLLQHLAKHSNHTKMSPLNLATCIAPSLYAPEVSLPSKQNSSNLKQVQTSVFEITHIFTPLISFMITKHIDIFGEDILAMFVKFGCEASPSQSLEEDRPIIQPGEEDEEEEMIGVGEEEEEEIESFPAQQSQKRHRPQLHQQQHQHLQRDSNSGTDSDSMHSVLSMPENGINLRHDNSSIDSLVDRDYFPNETESSPKVSKSHLSPSNLSRDSGLTLSDTQLYDEEVYHADVAAGATKTYQRSASHHVQHDMDIPDGEYYNYNSDHFDSKFNPTAPPRKRVTRKEIDYCEGSDGEQHIHAHQRPPFQHSSSTTQQDIYPIKGRRGEFQPFVTHPTLNKRISSDSIGEENEVQIESSYSADFHRLRKSTDIGILVKSENGTHLLLNDITQLAKYSINSKQQIVRQASVTVSTPPVSPQSRYSHSSQDSAISHDGSIQSAPQTPDESSSKPLAWLKDTGPTQKPSDGKLRQGLNISKSTSSLLCDNDDEDYFVSKILPSQENVEDYYPDTHVQKHKPSLHRLWSGKSHEAEEIEINTSPYFSLLNNHEECSIDLNSPVHPISPQQSKLSVKLQGLPIHLAKGSPPPSVILQSLKSPFQNNFMLPIVSKNSDTASQVRRSSIDSTEPYDVSKSMNALRPEEYLTVTSKPIMIISPQKDSSFTSRARFSKHVSSSMDLPLSLKERDQVLTDLKRPHKPPSYQQALQRNFMIKHSVPVDITTDDSEKQKEASARAKALYEQSLKLYNEERLKFSEAKKPRSQLSAESAVAFPESFKSVFDSPSSGHHYSSFALQEHPQTVKSQDSLDNSEAPGFLDMDSVSHSLQEDILNSRHARIGCYVNSASQNVSAASSVSVTRNDKLSDTGSSSGSSVTCSRHSDSFSHWSDISNVSNLAVSSPTIIDSSSGTNSVVSDQKTTPEIEQRNMAYSRHFRPLESASSMSFDPNNLDMVDNEEDVYITLKKDPRQLYLESMQLFEQRSPNGLSSSSASSLLNKPSSPQPLSLSSFSSSSLTSQQQTSSSCSQSSLQSSSSSAASVQNRNSSSTISGCCPPIKTLEVPSFSLQRSCSDSAEHINKLGAYSPRSVKTHDSLKDQKLGSIKLPKPVSPASDTKSELHQKFLSAKSVFHHPEDCQLTLSAFSLHPTPQTTNNSSFTLSSHDGQYDKCSSNTLDTTVTSAMSAYSTSILPSKSNHKQSHTSVGEHNKQLPWSVKQLKSLFSQPEHSHNSGGNAKGHSNPSSSGLGLSVPSSQTHPRNLPPYQNSPSFKHHQDNVHLDTANTSSSDHSAVVHKPLKSLAGTQNGPHSLSFDSYNSYSSTEDNYNPLDRRSLQSSESNTDSEAITDYSNITYV